MESPLFFVFLVIFFVIVVICGLFFLCFCCCCCCCFQIALAYGIGRTSADVVRCWGLLFEVLFFVFLIKAYPLIGPNSPTRIDNDLVIDDQQLPYTGHIRHAPSMDVVVNARSLSEIRRAGGDDGGGQRPYQSLKDRSNSGRTDTKDQDNNNNNNNGTTALVCCCFVSGANNSINNNNRNDNNNGNGNGNGNGNRNGNRNNPNENKADFGVRVDTDTEMSASGLRGPSPYNSPSPKASGVTQTNSIRQRLAKFSLGRASNNNSNKNSASVSASVVFNDPNALKFDIKNVERLIRDKIEYVEILSKDCAKQSDDRWKSAKILNIDKNSDNTSCKITVAYTDGVGTEIIDLTNDSDAARFRVQFFGHPEPYKLPMNDEFEIPQILVSLLAKLLNPDINGDRAVGVFRVSAEKTKLARYRTAVCQYKINSYDYRLPQHFTKQEEKNNAFDVHCIPALIKDWLRNFPETIVKYDEKSKILIPNVTKSPNDDLKENLFDWLSFMTLLVKYH